MGDTSRLTVGGETHLGVPHPPEPDATTTVRKHAKTRAHRITEPRQRWRPTESGRPVAEVRRTRHPLEVLDALLSDLCARAHGADGHHVRLWAQVEF